MFVNDTHAQDNEDSGKNWIKHLSENQYAPITLTIKETLNLRGNIQGYEYTFKLGKDIYMIDAIEIYGIGGILGGALVGGYVGYKIGRSAPQKTGFDTEKELYKNVKEGFKRNKSSRYGNVEDGDYTEVKYAKGGKIPYDEYADSLSDYGELDGKRVYNQHTERYGYINEDEIRNEGKKSGMGFMVWVSPDRDTDRGSNWDIDDTFIIEEEDYAKGGEAKEGGRYCVIGYENYDDAEGDLIDCFNTENEAIEEGHKLADKGKYPVIDIEDIDEGEVTYYIKEGEGSYFAKGGEIDKNLTYKGDVVGYRNEGTQRPTLLGRINIPKNSTPKSIIELAKSKFKRTWYVEVSKDGEYLYEIADDSYKGEYPMVTSYAKGGDVQKRGREMSRLSKKWNNYRKEAGSQSVMIDDMPDKVIDKMNKQFLKEVREEMKKEGYAKGGEVEYKYQGNKRVNDGEVVNFKFFGGDTYIGELKIYKGVFYLLQNDIEVKRNLFGKEGRRGYKYASHLGDDLRYDFKTGFTIQDYAKGGSIETYYVFDYQGNAVWKSPDYDKAKKLAIKIGGKVGKGKYAKGGEISRDKLLKMEGDEIMDYYWENTTNHYKSLNNKDLSRVYRHWFANEGYSLEELESVERDEMIWDLIEDEKRYKKNYQYVENDEDKEEIIDELFYFDGYAKGGKTGLEKQSGQFMFNPDHPRADKLEKLNFERVLKDSQFMYREGDPKNELNHNRLNKKAIIGKTAGGYSVAIVSYTPNTKRHLHSQSFSTPQALLEYLDKNQIYAKGGTMSSIWKKSKELGKKGWSKSKELAHEANERRKEHLHFKRKEISRNVGIETSAIIDEKVKKGEITKKKADKLNDTLVDATIIQTGHYKYPEGPKAKAEMQELTAKLDREYPYFGKGGKVKRDIYGRDEEEAREDIYNEVIQNEGPDLQEEGLTDDEMQDELTKLVDKELKELGFARGGKIDAQKLADRVVKNLKGYGRGDEEYLDEEINNIIYDNTNFPESNDKFYNLHKKVKKLTLKEFPKGFAKGGVTEKDQQSIIQEGSVIEYVDRGGGDMAEIGYRDFYGTSMYYIMFNAKMVHSSKTYKSMLRKLNQLKEDYSLRYRGVKYAKGGFFRNLFGSKNKKSEKEKEKKLRRYSHLYIISDKDGKPIIKGDSSRGAKSRKEAHDKLMKELQESVDSGYYEEGEKIEIFTPKQYKESGYTFAKGGAVSDHFEVVDVLAGESFDSILEKQDIIDWAGEIADFEGNPRELNFETAKEIMRDNNLIVQEYGKGGKVEQEAEMVVKAMLPIFATIPYEIRKKSDYYLSSNLEKWESPLVDIFWDYNIPDNDNHYDNVQDKVSDILIEKNIIGDKAKKEIKFAKGGLAEEWRLERAKEELDFYGSGEIKYKDWSDNKIIDWYDRHEYYDNMDLAYGIKYDSKGNIDVILDKGQVPYEDREENPDLISGNEALDLYASEEIFTAEQDLRIDQAIDGQDLETDEIRHDFREWALYNQKDWFEEDEEISGNDRAFEVFRDFDEFYDNGSTHRQNWTAFLEYAQDALPKYRKGGVILYKDPNNSYTIVIDDSVFDMNEHRLNYDINTYIGERSEFPEDVSHWGKKINLKDAPIVIRDKVKERQNTSFEKGGTTNTAYNYAPEWNNITENKRKDILSLNSCSPKYSSYSYKLLNPDTKEQINIYFETNKDKLGLSKEERETQIRMLEQALIELGGKDIEIEGEIKKLKSI